MGFFKVWSRDDLDLLREQTEGHYSFQIRPQGHSQKVSCPNSATVSVTFCGLYALMWVIS